MICPEVKTMKLCELLTELKAVLEPKMSNNEFLVVFFNDILRDPKTNKEHDEENRGIYNPLAGLGKSSQEKIASGKGIYLLSMLVYLRSVLVKKKHIHF